MAEQFGIRLAVSPADLVTSINEAIAKINSGNSLHKVKIGADTSELESAIKRIKSEIASITGRSSTTPVALGTTRADGQATLDELAALRKAEEELANPVGMAAVQAEFNKTAEIVKGLTDAVSAFKSEYASIASINTSINIGTSGNVGANVGDAVKQSVDQTTASLKQQEQAEKDVANAAKEGAAKSVSAKNDIAKTIREIETAIRSLNSTTNKSIFQQNRDNPEVSALNNDIKKIKNDYQGLINTLKSGGSTENLAKVNAEMESLRFKTEDVKVRAGELASSFRNITIDDNVTSRLTELHAKIVSLMSANSKGLDKLNPNTGNTFRTDLEAILTKFPEAQAQGMTLVKTLENGFRNIDAQMKITGATGKTLLQELHEKATKFIKWTAMTLVITKARMYFRQLFTTVYELDTALIDLKKTFKGTDEELNNFYLDANRLAKQMGVTTKEIISQAAAFSRLGYSSNEAMKKMAEMSSMFASISPDMNVDKATNGLVSIMKAFDIDPDNVLDGILSKVNIIGNTAATSNGEIVEMLEKSSSAMKEANNTLEETIALETAAVEITRDASSVGNAYKTVSMRIRGYSEETEAYTEDVEELSGKIAELTKTAATPGGISLFSDVNKTTYKSTYQLLKEISKIYDQLTDRQQAGLLEALAGKRQGQIIAATITNFEAAEEALRNMANSAGSAEAEMETIRESAAYAMNELKETFTSLAQHSVSRGGLKNLIKFGTSALNVVDKIVEKIGLIPTILTTIIGITASKKLTKGGILGLATNEKTGKMGLTAFGSQVGSGWFGSIFGNPQKQEIKAATNAVKEFHQAFQNGTMTADKYNSVLNHSNSIVRNYAQAIKMGATESDAYNAATGRLNAQLKQTGVSGKLAAVGLKAAQIGVQMLNTAISMGISLLVSWGLSKLIEVISSAVNYTKNLNKRVKDLNSEYKSITSEIESLNGQLADTQAKIVALEKLPKLSLLQKEELEELKKYNDELERQRKAREAEAEANRREARADAYKGYEKDNKNQYLSPILNGAFDDVGSSKLEQQAKLLKGYEKMLEGLEKLKREGDGSKESEEEITRLQKLLDQAAGEIKDFYSVWTDRYEALYDSDIEAYQNAASEYKELIDKWDRILGVIPTNIKGLFGEYGYVKQQLIDLAREGKLTAESFEKLTEQDVSGIDDFREALEKLEDGTTVADVIESIISELEDLEDEVPAAEKRVADFNKELERLQNLLDKIITKQEKLSDVFKRVRLGESLSAQEVYELSKEFSDIYEYIERTVDGWTVSAEGIKALNKEILKTEQNSLKEDIKTLNDQINPLKELAELYKSDLRTSFPGSDIGNLERFNKALEETEELREKLGITSLNELDDVVGKLEKERDSYQFLLDTSKEIFDNIPIVDSYDEMKSVVSDYNNNIKTLDSAIKSLNEGLLLSYDEMVSLVEIAPELQDFFEKQENGYTISASKIEEWRAKSYEARNEYIQGLIEQARIDVATAEQEKKTAGTLLNIAKQFGTEEDILRAQIVYDAADAQLNKAYDIIKKLEALMGEITYDADKENDDLSDRLQDEIDYYKTIFDAVEIMRDNYLDAFDEQIDALNDEKDAINEVKDALEEENDERKRALALAEALTNLENAKKRKVWVYSDDGGFRQVQDEGAVKKAAEEYRDVLVDIQKAELDAEIKEKEAQIKELEKQKEQFEDKYKDFTDFEKNLQDAMTVEQAKAALGLVNDEDLLNLSEAVKEGIKEGFADAFVTKENEDNKGKTDRNGNSLYTPVTAEDILKSLGATITADDIKSISSDLTTLAEYATAKTTAHNLKEYADEATTTVINNTGNNISVTNNIYDARDPEKVAEVVRDEIAGLFTKVENSIK